MISNFRVIFLAAPIFHRGERAGNIYLAEKEAGKEFTRETLMYRKIGQPVSVLSIRETVVKS